MDGDVFLVMIKRESNFFKFFPFLLLEVGFFFKKNLYLDLNNSKYRLFFIIIFHNLLF